MSTQAELSALFNRLHVKGDPIVLINVWDAGSAKVIQEIGAKALATGSWSVAAVHGYPDGEQIPLALVLENLKRIVNSVDLPISLDFEGAYGVTPDEVEANVAKVIEAGAVGINFEDQIVNGEGLYSIEEHTLRIAAARRAADQASLPFYINARTDIFLKAPADTHNAAMLDEAIERGKAYQEAGASGFFTPGLRNADFIKKLCQESQLPINILYLPDVPSRTQLAELGVARLSYGSTPYREAMKALRAAGTEALAQ